MERDSRDGASQLPTRSRSAITVRSDGAIAGDWEGGQEALPQIVRQVREGSRQPYGTFLRRVLFFWLRVYVFEVYTNGKSKAVNVRIPIPLPLIGAFFQSKLSWSQAFQFIERSRRTQGIPAERFLESCMALEFVRVYEDKEEKEELVVVGLD
ncbi:MAG: hypothetical protein OXI80_02530 [Caldilineaceae bacterium]|nr:hypothetical protein [Caldilineaceae bacterium]MDE0336523.1 hypothetical protein [Caldilineaceae bacterium]